MKLNTARKIEKTFAWILCILLLPVEILFLLILLVKYPLEWIHDCKGRIIFKVGNKLMHMSDAVKDGTIKNPYCLRNYTARMAWKHLKEAEKSKKEAII